jgi:hypothetical protein
MRGAPRAESELASAGQEPSSDEALGARLIPERHPSHHRLFLIIYSGLGRRRAVSEAVAYAWGVRGVSEAVAYEGGV